MEDNVRVVLYGREGEVIDYFVTSADRVVFDLTTSLLEQGWRIFDKPGMRIEIEEN